KYLKIFTFLSREEIEALEGKVETEAHLREAQKTLASEMTKMIHGEEGLEQALKITAALFSGDLKALSVEEMKVAFSGVPSVEVAKADAKIVELLVEAKISPSKRQAREDVTNGAISINGEKVQDLEYTIDAKDRLEDSFTIIRRGKKKYFMVKFA
ncbi:MAG: S4 domain-containing protein, partial [Kurthia sp.]